MVREHDHVTKATPSIVVELKVLHARLLHLHEVRRVEMMISVGIARHQEERRHGGQGELGVLLVPCSEVVGLPDAKASGNQRASVQEPEHVIGNEEAHLWPQPHRALVLKVLFSVQEHPCDMAPCLHCQDTRPQKLNLANPINTNLLCERYLNL